MDSRRQPSSQGNPRGVRLTGEILISVRDLGFLPMTSVAMSAESSGELHFMAES